MRYERKKNKNKRNRERVTERGGEKGREREIDKVKEIKKINKEIGR